MIGSLLTALCGVLLAASSLFAAPITEVESNDTLGTPQMLAAADFTRPAPADVFAQAPTVSITGQITAADIDFYAFTGAAGHLLTIDIDGTPSGSFLGLALFDPSGLLFAVSIGADPDPGTDPLTFDPFIGTLALPTSGVYTVGVFDFIGTLVDFPLTGLSPLLRPDGADGGVRFTPIAPDITVSSSGVDTDYTLHISQVPEPSSALLLCSGMLVGLLLMRRRQA